MIQIIHAQMLDVIQYNLLTVSKFLSSDSIFSHCFPPGQCLAE